MFVSIKPAKTKTTDQEIKQVVQNENRKEAAEVCYRNDEIQLYDWKGGKKNKVKAILPITAGLFTLFSI